MSKQNLITDFSATDVRVTMRQIKLTPCSPALRVKAHTLTAIHRSCYKTYNEYGNLCKRIRTSSHIKRDICPDKPSVTVDECFLILCATKFDNMSESLIGLGQKRVTQ